MQPLLAALLMSCCAPIPREPLPDQYAPGYFGIHMTTDANGVVKLIDVLEGTPAARAGLKASDILVKVGDYTIVGEEPLREMIVNLQPGSRHQLVIKRDGQNRNMTIQIGTKPETPRP